MILAPRVMRRHTVRVIARAGRGTDEESGKALVADALEHAQAANRELRELAHGLLPDMLTRGGLAAAVESIVPG